MALLLRLFAAETMSSGARAAIGARADFNIRKLSWPISFRLLPFLSDSFHPVTTQLRAARGDDARASVAFGPFNYWIS